MSFSPLRLSIARKRAMLNKKGFSDAIGVTQHAVVRWEKGQAEKWWKNGSSEVKKVNCPGEGWVRGRLKSWNPRAGKTY